MNFQEGEILYFNKPLYWTSFKLVNEVRYALCKALKIKRLKVGHAGTLDPLATGVMIICTGKATKRIEEFQHLSKEYIATLQLGATTPSFDLETEIDERFAYAHIDEAQVQETLKQFIGEIRQVPPMFSACKVQGKRAYEMARKGEHIELESKLLVIDELELLEHNLNNRAKTQEEPVIKIRVVCSKGTYIRALARDIGRALGSGAHLTALVRSRVGDIGLDDCRTIGEFKKELEKQLIQNI